MNSHLRYQREEIVGVIPPPPGIVPNFDNPPSMKTTLVVVDVTLIVISTVFVVLRLYTAQFILRRVNIPDYAIMAAWFLGLASTICTIIATRYGLGLHLWDVPFTTFNIHFGLVGNISGVFYGLSVMCSKCSILVFLLRLSPHRMFKSAVYVVLVAVILYSLIGSFELLYLCQPIAKNWDLTITTGSCINATSIYIFSGAMNTLTDIVILTLPVIIVWGIHLPIRQKVGVVATLMTGGFVVVISIIRLVNIIRLIHQPDISWVGGKNLIWWHTEMHVSIVCACLPLGKAFCRRHFPNVFERSFGWTTYGARRTGRSTKGRSIQLTKSGTFELVDDQVKCKDGDIQRIQYLGQLKIDEEAVSQTNGSLCSAKQVPVQVEHAV